MIDLTLDTYDGKYLRVVIPTPKHSNTGAIEELIDLNTDQGVMYGSGHNSFKIKNKIFEKFIFSNEGVNYNIIESSERIDLLEFDKISDVIFMSLSLLYGTKFKKFGYIISSDSQDFSVINSILFYTRDKDFGHENPIYKSHEIRGYKFSDDYFLFPKKAFNKLCEGLFKSEKFRRAVYIIFEAYQNKYSLSKCILFASCIETLATIIKTDTIRPIDIERFDKSKIVELVTKAISESKELTNEDKEFLIDKKVKYLNSPTNPDRLAAIFKKLGLILPEKFVKALKYRNYYLHGNIPKGEKLGAFDSDNYNRSFELQFLANALILKYVGYQGVSRN